MSQNTADLRPFLLTQQEARRVYTALDVVADMMAVLGDNPDPARELRDRFRDGDTA